MSRWVTVFIVFVMMLVVGSPAFAQRGARSGGGSTGGQRATPKQTPEEATQAAVAKEFADVIAEERAKAPPLPVPQIRFPSKNESFLSSLCCVASPPAEVVRYLDKMWNGAKDLQARRAAVESFWQEAVKPPWVRPAIEDFFRQRNGAVLHPTQPSPRPSPAPKW